MTRVDGPEPGRVQLALDGRWLEFPVHDDVDVRRWSRRLVDEALAAREVTAPKAQRKAYADMYAQLLAVLRSTADEPDMKLMSAYCYVPDTDLLYAALVKLVALALPLDSTIDDAVSSLVTAPAARYGEERITELETAGGRCVRIQQLLLDDAGGADSGVTSSLSYVWATEEDSVFLVLVTTFASPVEGALHEEALDELAATLTKGAGV